MIQEKPKILLNFLFFLILKMVIDTTFIYGFFVIIFMKILKIHITLLEFYIEQF